MTSPQSSILGGDERVRGGSPSAARRSQEGQREGGAVAREGGCGLSATQEGRSGLHGCRNSTRQDCPDVGRITADGVSDHALGSRKPSIDNSLLLCFTCGVSSPLTHSTNKNPNFAPSRQTRRGVGANTPERSTSMLPEHVSRDQYTHSPVSVDPDAGVAA